MTSSSSLSPQIATALQGIASLPRQHGQAAWADAFSARQRELTQGAPVEEVAQAVRRWFGGAGSLNDLILQSGGQADVPANRQLGELTDGLHALLRQVISYEADDRFR